MDIFKGQNLLEFAGRFKTDEDCRAYLADVKWGDGGFRCRKCGHGRCQVRKNGDRTCNRCSDIESPTAGTLFHKVKFGLRNAFPICFEMSTSTKGLSASYLSVRYGISRKSAGFFMNKVREAMRSSESHPMDGDVHIDEFVVDGRDPGKPGRSYDSRKKKAVCAVQLTPDGRVGRMYIKRVNDFSSKSLTNIFERHIDRGARVRTDEWKGYVPIAAKHGYSIVQVPSSGGLNFRALHTMVHQVKSWIRTVFSWVSSKHIERYFDEFCYRINRSQMKATVFHNLIKRMASRGKLYRSQIAGN